MTIIPAYGRDYDTKAQVLAAWNAGQDFVLADIFDSDDGRKINLQDARKAGLRVVNCRYKGLTKIAVIKVTHES